MSQIKYVDTDGNKSRLLPFRHFGLDNYPAGGDVGRVYVGTGSENIPLAKKAEMLAVDGKADVHIARVDNPHSVTKAQVGLSNVDNTSDANKPVSTATQSSLNLKANDSAVVKLTGDQTVAGVKTFSSNIVGNVTGNSGTATKLSTTRANYKNTTDSIVVGELMWKRFGNGHTILDASDSTAPNGVTINNVNPTLPWDEGFPTIVGFNGNETSGVRVDSSRYADQLKTSRTINGVSFDGSANITISDSTAVKLTGDQTVAGVKTFSSNPISTSTQATAVNALTRKDYVDTKVAKVTSTDNSIVRFDGIGGDIKNSQVIIDDNGSVLISHSAEAGAQYMTRYDVNNYALVRNNNTVDTIPIFETAVAGVIRAAILSNGTYQSATNVYGSTSDIKLKENVVDATPKLDKLMNVKVKNFNYIGQEDKQIGVIAQEIEEVFPSVVFETKDTKQVEVTKEIIIPAVDEIIDAEGNIIQEAKPEAIEEYTETETQETGEVTKNVKYSVLYMIAIKALQELNAKVEAMQLEINELKGAE